MKRLFAGLLLTGLLSAPAGAKVLVTWDHHTGGTDETAITQETQNQLLAVTSILRAHGSDFRVVHPSLVKTEFARIGVMTWGFGTAYPHTEPFDAVIHLMFNGTGTTSYSNYRPDSLTLTRADTQGNDTRGLPEVPQLFVVANTKLAQTSSCMNDATSDTTGCAGGTFANQNHEGEQTLYVPGLDWQWLCPTYTGQLLKVNATPPAGGRRTILTSGMNAVFAYEKNTTHPAPLWPDSLGRNTTDTLLVWDRMNTHVTGAKPIVFCFPPNNAVSDSAGNDMPYAISWPILMVAMSHLDSLSGGKVFGSIPKRVAPVVEGAGLTRWRQDPLGLFRADSTFFKASMDSVAKHGIPLTVAADPESLTAAEASWWKRARNVRFTPSSWVGIVDTTAAGLGNASWTHPLDAWGHYRARAFYSPGNGAAWDTSLCSLLKAGRSLLRATVGSSYLSRLAVAPLDDWTPISIGKNSPGGMDSLYWAVRRAGFTAILADGQRTDNVFLAEPVGGWPTQRTERSRIDGQDIRILAHSGRSPVGSTNTATGAFWGYSPDSADALCATVCPGMCTPDREAHRYWGQLYQDSFRDMAVWGTRGEGAADDQVGVRWDIADVLFDVRHGSILKLSMQQFGGTTADPARIGFTALKNFDSARRAINALAGRQLIQWAWPEDIEP